MNNIETALYKTSYPKNDPYGTLQMPVYNNVAYEFETAEEMEEIFCGRTAGYSYSRIANPTVQYFEDKIKNITGAFSVTALNSGMAAIANTIIALAQSGANIITSKHLFGNTYSILNSTLRAFGLETRFCDLTNIGEVKANIDENTCAVFLEIITNPQLEIADLAALSKMAKANNVPLVADTTIVPFCAFRAKDFGVDIEIVSATKYISGGGTSLGGLIIDYASFDWTKSKKLKQLAEQQGNGAFTFKIKREIHRNLGAYMTAQVAYMQTVGLETLSIRFEHSSGTCLKLAEELSKIDKIKSVNYTGLKNNPYYEISTKQFGKFPGSVLTFDLGSKEECFSFLNKLKFIKRATNLFDNRTLAIHPESTIFGTFPKAERIEMDVKDTTIRLSVGLENFEDIFGDIKQALN
jgi:O-acetylhomoserine (thiol)-lyase